MRVLVLGGTGLISTAIVQRLIDRGHEPILFNRGQTASRVGADVETITGDRQDFGAFQAQVKQIQVDAAIDMITFDPRTAAHATELFQGRLHHYLFCSTVCVYGGPLLNVPADEGEPLRPVSDYGRDKRAAEHVFMTAYNQSEFPVTVFRPSHCYGPGRPLLDIWGYNSALVQRIRDGRPIIVPGDGSGFWQPGFIGDVAKGFVGALGREATFGQAYNAVGDEIMTWRTFHERMAKAIGCEANIVCMTTPQILAGAPRDKTPMLEEIFQFHAAYSNARLKGDVPEFTNLLPWEEGVRRTVAWMDETGAHHTSDTCPWIDELASKARGFEAALAKDNQA